MKSAFLLFTFLLTLNCGYTRDDQANLLADSKYGMSVKEVREIFKDVISNPNPDSISSTNSTSLLIIKEYVVVTTDIRAVFEVEFFFNENNLTNVNLTSKNPSLKQANSLYNILTKKYGKPIEETRYNSISNHHIQWHKNGTDVGITYSEAYNGNPSELWLNYSSYTPKALNSL